MPVQHLVYFKFHPDVEQAHREQLRGDLLALKAQIPAIQSIHAGFNFTDRSAGHQLGLIVTLPDRDALTTYLEHPAHVKVGGALRAACDSILALDFEED